MNVRASILILVCSATLGAQGPSRATVDRAATAQQLYRQRVREHRPRSVEEHLELARWCAREGLSDEARRHARAVLRREPDHAGARDLLGQRKVHGRWMPEEQARRALGFVEFEGRWRLPQEIEYLKRARAKRAAAEAADRAARSAADVRELRRTLAGASEPARERAYAELRTIARDTRDRELERWAHWAYRTYRDAWVEYRRAVARRGIEFPVGILSLNLQKVDVLGIDTVPVSFGTAGGGARLQLPRTRSISFGGTVAVPLGFGR